VTPRCGKCKNCLDLDRVRSRVLACCNPPFSHVTRVGSRGDDYGTVNLWNTELARLPCTNPPKEEPSDDIQRMVGEELSRLLDEIVAALDESQTKALIKDLTASMDLSLTRKVSRLSRERCVALLEGVSIQCYDTESTEELREAVYVNVLDCNIDAEEIR